MDLQKLSRLAAATALCACLAVGVSAMAIGSSEPVQGAGALSASPSSETVQAVSAGQSLAGDKASLEPQEDAAGVDADAQAAEEEARETEEATQGGDVSDEPSDGGQAEAGETAAGDSGEAAESGEASAGASEDSSSASEDVSVSFPTVGTVNSGGSGLNMRNGSGSSCDIMASIPNGTVLTLTGLENGWYQIKYNGSVGYVNSQYVTLGGSAADAATSAEAETSTRAESSAEAESSDADTGSDGSSDAGNSTASSAAESSAASGSSSSDASSGTAAALVEYARQFLGCSYVYATAGPTTFDCSGFTYYVFAHFGYTLSRSSAAQYYDGEVIEMDESQMQVGDLLLWRTYGSSDAANHVGIYIGNGQYIHASSASGCVTISSLSTVSNHRYLVGVRRIISD
ncbi:MAG: C40 family peptidase [Oscillospiraceae bacterium]|nr:C40 family peptidase [Oscillospiraceae bacterium]